VDLLKERGIYERCIFILTADHGESFGENDFLTHWHNDMGDFEATRHVPLMIVPEFKSLQEAVTIQEDVSIADIMPTLEELLGIEYEPRPGQRFGRSLADHLRPYSSEPANRVVLEFEEGATGETRSELEQRLKSLGYIGD
jgi:arylsulfatase A-like enzyme